MNKVDVLAVGAHPDDVELGIGGTLHKLSERGYRVAVLALTRGEMGTRGTVEERAQEAAEAARILGIADRANVGLPDGGLANTVEQRLEVIPFIRTCRPGLILVNGSPDRHPDHAAAAALVRDANFYAGLKRIDTGQEPHRTPRLLHYHPYFDAEMATFVVDISGHFDVKLEALRAYASQFYNPDYEAAPTRIASKSFWDSISARAVYWGAQIGTTHGEALLAPEPVGLDLPVGFEPETEVTP